MGDYIEKALEEQRQMAGAKAAAATAREARTERRASGEKQLPPVDEQQPSLRREASMASEAASGDYGATSVRWLDAFARRSSGIGGPNGFRLRFQ